MTHRKVVGLLWARLCESPFSGTKRPRGTKGQGLRYEHLVAKAIPIATHGQWFEFCDANGPGFCSTDLLLNLGHSIAILECKLTDWPEAKEQVDELYRPIVKMVFNRPALGVVVAKGLSHKTNTQLVVPTLAQALFIALRQTPTWHNPFPRLAHLSDDLRQLRAMPLAPPSPAPYARTLSAPTGHFQGALP